MYKKALGYLNLIGVGSASVMFHTAPDDAQLPLPFPNDPQWGHDGPIGRAISEAPANAEFVAIVQESEGGTLSLNLYAGTLAELRVEFPALHAQYYAGLCIHADWRPPALQQAA
jgi:hypothetical protein